MTDEEIQAKIDAAVEEATKGLIAKRDELMEEKKKLQKADKEKEERLAALEAAKEEAEAAAAEKSGDVEKIKASIEAKAKKEAEALKAQLEAAQSRLNQTLVDGGLKDALIKANVAPHHLPAVTALIKATAKSEIVDQDGNTVATFDGKPIEEFVTGWAQGDTGKHYIAAPNNGGGGASGSNGGGKASGVKQMKRSEFDALPADKRMEVSKSGVQLTNE